jgi:alcohol dehydrogenase
MPDEKSAGDFPARFEFSYPRIRKVIFGPSILAQATLAQLGDWRLDRVVIAVSRSLRESLPVEQLVTTLTGAGIVCETFSESMRHCPVDAAVQLAERSAALNAQAVIAVGGSSVSDCTKAANLLRARDAGTGSSRALSTLIDDTAGMHLPMRCIAAPTTLSGGEFTPVVGISEGSTGRKHVLRHAGLCPELIVLDPDLLALTPPELLASTGIKLLDHAVERLLARNHLPLIDAQCVHGIGLLLPRLEPAVRAGPDVRQSLHAELLQILWVIQSSHGNVGTGLSHALSHQLGSACGLDHGTGSALCLPTTLRLLERSGRIDAGRRAILAGAFGIQDSETAIESIADRIESLARQLGLPKTLAEAGILQFDVESVAAAVLGDPTVRASPGHPLDAREIESLLSELRDSRP